MDNAAKWFLAGIFVSLVNTVLVLVFIGIPDIPGIPYRLGSNAEVEIVEVPAEPRTYVIVLDEEGNVISSRTEVSGDGASSGDAADGDQTAAAVAEQKRSLDFEDPVFAEVTGPTFIAARDGVAWVATQRLELWRVDLEGEVEEVDLDGIESLGASVIVGVDVDGEGTLYALVSDRPPDWRLFKRAADEDQWEVATSSDLAGWPADVVALTVADTGTVYISAADPRGIFRIEPDMEQARDWVTGGVEGLDTAGDDTHLLYTLPQTRAEIPVAQVAHVRDGFLDTYRTQYDACPDGDGGDQADALIPHAPRDVALLDAGRVLVVDTLNHVVWLQEERGGGEPVFGVPCERGTDEDHLYSPRGVAVDEDGNVFISDRSNNRVVVLAAR